MEFARDSHSIPQFYLRGWSTDSSHVWARRLLVPAEKYPEWKLQPLRSLTVYQHLYTSVRGGKDSDDFERWINREFESPAGEALERVRDGAPLNLDHMQRLALFAATLDLRTPASYLEDTKRWETQLPRIIESTLARAKRELRRAAKTGIPPALAPDTRRMNPPMHITTTPLPGSRMVQIKAGVVIGREMWLEANRLRLTGIAAVLKEHQWRIMRPYRDAKWFTSDHPVLRLNYNSPDDYDFGGGWGSPGSEIILPLSPSHLLYTRIGHSAPKVDEFNREETLLLQRLIAERAHRWHIADSKVLRAEWFRRRVVDKAAFIHEEKEWATFHQSQRDAERSMASPPGRTDEVA